VALLLAEVITAGKFAIADKRAAELRLTTVKFFGELAAEAFLLRWDLTCVAGSLVAGLLAPMETTVEHAATSLLATVLSALGYLAGHKFSLLLAVALH
jgi:hypothetical protein